MIQDVNTSDSHFLQFSNSEFKNDVLHNMTVCSQFHWPRYPEVRIPVDPVILEQFKVHNI